MARHELTQGQWLRMSLCENPSQYPGDKPLRGLHSVEVALDHPVESVSWFETTDLVATHGLRLPTEEEWEYGCRAGTTTPWFSGSEAADLEHHANILDAFAKRLAKNWTGEFEQFSDGHVIHAPVGTFRPNAFGLYDMHGNVAEWTSGLYRTPIDKRVSRGGNYGSGARGARAANRRPSDPTECSHLLGVRVARGCF